MITGPCTHRWIPVLDGDRDNDNDGMGWVQIGDPGCLGKNHKEAFDADCGWGDASKEIHWKGPWIYCVIDEAVTTKTGNWAGWDTARFVAFDDAGDNRVAFRNPGTKRWLRVTPDGVTDRVEIKFRAPPRHQRDQPNSLVDYHTGDGGTDPGRVER